MLVTSGCAFLIHSVVIIYRRNYSINMQKRQIGNHASLHPLIKWVGGKSQLLVKLRSMMPKSYNTYYEPFAGGLALYCNLCPKQAVINDINPKLINIYTAVKSNTNTLISLLDNLQSQFNNYSTQRERERTFTTKFVQSSTMNRSTLYMRHISYF